MFDVRLITQESSCHQLLVWNLITECILCSVNASNLMQNIKRMKTHLKAQKCVLKCTCIPIAYLNNLRTVCWRALTLAIFQKKELSPQPHCNAPTREQSYYHLCVSVHNRTKFPSGSIGINPTSTLPEKKLICMLANVVVGWTQFRKFIRLPMCFYMSFTFESGVSVRSVCYRCRFICLKCAHGQFYAFRNFNYFLCLLTISFNEREYGLKWLLGLCNRATAYTASFQFRAGSVCVALFRIEFTFVRFTLMKR